MPHESQNPILRHKFTDEPSVFLPQNLLREARRQKEIPEGQVPAICVLDPDGDILRHLSEKAKRNPYWACYHTELYNIDLVCTQGSLEEERKRGFGGLCKGNTQRARCPSRLPIGLIACAVGASFAVLIAEQLFVSGCKLLISITSSGQIVPKENPPYFVLIEKALRDEGTSYHYLPPSDYAQIDKRLLRMLSGAFADLSFPVYQGATWTTDAPFRETEHAIEHARNEGILAVEMEAAALYAFAQARQRAVICFAHVTNQMGNVEQDFEKGEKAGSRDALQVITSTAKAWLGRTKK